MSSIRKSIRRPSRCSNASICAAVASSSRRPAVFGADPGAVGDAAGGETGAAAPVVFSAAATSDGIWSLKRMAKNVLNANVNRAKKGFIVGTAQLRTKPADGRLYCAVGRPTPARSSRFVRSLHARQRQRLFDPFDGQLDRITQMPAFGGDFVAVDRACGER